MADDTTQRIAHKFFIEKLNTLESFTKQDLMTLTGWDKSSADAYWSKQYKNILENIGADTLPHEGALPRLPRLEEIQTARYAGQSRAREVRAKHLRDCCCLRVLHAAHTRSGFRDHLGLAYSSRTYCCRG